uniref:Family with sequence similarity 210 member Aa n=4 Tax=Cyprinus carpio TaxID=7962 RepID=A0A9J8BHI6_CYPCA
MPDLFTHTAGSRSLFGMQRLVCARVPLQISGASCSRPTQMLAPAARGCWTRLRSGSPASQRNSSREHPGQEDPDPLQDKSIGLMQRFKKTFKQYGKVMIPVHLLTSTVWFGTFYYAAMKGVSLVPFLEYVGFPDKVVKLLENSQSGYALTAYAMFKVATPARYTVTLGGTSLSVKYLREHGYMSTPPPVKEYLQEKMEETKERISGKMEETKDRISERMEETKDKFTEKLQEPNTKCLSEKRRNRFIGLQKVSK